MKAKNMIKFMTYLWIGVTVITIIAFSNSDTQPLMQKNIETPYSKVFEDGVLWYNVSFTAWSNSQVRIHVVINGSISVMLYETPFQLKKTTISLLNNTYKSPLDYKTDRETVFTHTYTTSVYTRYALAFKVSIPSVNLSNQSEVQLLTRKASIEYQIGVIDIVQSSDIQTSVLLHLLFLEFIIFFFALSTIVIVGYTCEFAKPCKKTSLAQPLSIEEIKKLHVQGSKEKGEELWRRYLLSLVPDILFLSVIFLVFYGVFMENFGQYPKVLNGEFTFLAYTFSNEKQLLFVSCFIGIPSFLAVFGFNLKKKDFEHFWTYSHGRQRFMKQISVLAHIVLLSMFLLVCVFQAYLYGHYLFGTAWWSWITLTFIAGFLIHAFLSIMYFNVVFSMKNILNSEELTLMSAILLLGLFEKLNLIGISNTYFMHAWRTGEYPYVGLGVLLLSLSASYILFVYSFRVTKVIIR